MDPRKRLQVLNQANPSIRLSAAPKPPTVALQATNNPGGTQQITQMGTAPAQNLHIGNTTIKPTGGTIQPGKNPNNFSLVDVAKGIGESVAKPYDYLSKGVAEAAAYGSNDQKMARQSAAQAQDASTQNIITAGQKLKDPTVPIAEKLRWQKVLQDESAKSNELQANAAARNQEIIDRTDPMKGAAAVASIGTDIATAGMGVEGGAGVKAALAGGITKKGLQTAGTIAGKNALLGVPGGVADAYLQNGKNTTLGDVLRSTATSAAVSGAIPLASAGIRKILKIPSAADVGLTHDELKFIKKSNDPEQIHTFLSSLAGGDTAGLRDLAGKLADSKSTKEIVHAIEDLPIEAGAASAIAGTASSALAREKYGVDPVTGETAPPPIDLTPPLEERPFGPDAPQQEGIPLGSVPDAQFTKIEQDALKQVGAEPPTFSERLQAKRDEASAPTPEDNLRMSPINENAKDVVTHPAHSDSVTKAILNSPVDNTSNDAMTTAIRAIAQSPNKGEVRSMLETLFHDKPTGESVLKGNDLNRAVKDLTGETDPEVVKQRLHDELVKHDANQAAAAEAPQPTATPTTEELSKSTPDSGAVAPAVKENGATAKTEAQSTDTTVDDTVNKAADQESKTIRYTDAETGKTKIATVADLRQDINDFIDKHGTEELTPKQQRKLDELQRNLHVATFDAKTHMTGATPEEQAAVQKIVDGLGDNLKNYDSAKKLRAKERAVKFAKGEGASNSVGGGFDGYKAQLGSLKGKLSAPQFNSVNVDPQARDNILNLIEDNGKARGWQTGKRLNTKTAILKVMGEVDGAPTPSDIHHIREFFGDEVANSVQEVVDKHPKDWKAIATGIAGLPKSLMSTLDFSAPRQAGQLAAAHPVTFMKRYTESMKAAFNDTYYQAQMKKLRDNPNLDTITEDMGVDLPGVNVANEEKMANLNVAEKIPGYGKTVIQGSQRAYTYLLAHMRHDVANRTIENAGGVEAYKSAMAKNYGDKAKDATRAYGEMINTLSGRGGAKGGVLERHMATASATLFSPRLWASKLQQLNPVWYGKLLKENPRAAKEAIQAQAAFYSMVGTTLFLASKTPGVDVGTDMRSADFGKIKVGNTRFDIMGGQQQNIVQAWRQVTGEKVNSETGEVTKLGEGFGTTNRFDLFVSMLTSKSNPLIATSIAAAKGHDYKANGDYTTQFGDKGNIFGDLGKLTVPLNASGMVTTSQDTGSVAKGVAMNLPGVVGVGVNTYGSIPTKNKGQKNDQGVAEYKGKVEANMVTDDSGKVILDDKGRPVTVDIPEGATKAEIRALKDAKKESAVKAVYKNTLSGEDKALLGRSDGELKKYVQDGTITQAKADQIKTERQKMTALGAKDDASKLPEGLSVAQKAFLTKLNASGDENFTKHGATTKESQAVVDELNNNPNNPKNVPKLGKGNNQLAKLYTDYQADIKKNEKNDTIIDRQNKAKEFWTKAIKTQYDSMAQDLVAEGNSYDYKALVSQGKISKKQLDQAIQLDNALYQTGFAKMKFGKKFREEYGYGVPSKTASGDAPLDGGGSGSGSGSGKKTNAHLSDYLISDNAGGSKSDVPKFSAKGRAIKFKSTAKIPGGPSGKKISINL